MITARSARPEDAPAMCALLNPIIEEGSTTAYRTPFDTAQMVAHYIENPVVLSCVVAEEAGEILGFQGIFLTQPARDGSSARWAEIGSFVSAQAQGKGVGQIMWAETKARSIAAGVDTIGATIRTDNVPGLAYYSGLGFTDYGAVLTETLSDGTQVQKACKRFDFT